MSPIIKIDISYTVYCIPYTVYWSSTIEMGCWGIKVTVTYASVIYLGLRRGIKFSLIYVLS